ncbi:phage repressor protein CI [Photorhabdus australis]|uniref:phage repressor protein CI n=1 Tax=Photorhabdus australis TaxID=286156 RepID=UPI00055E6AA8|nr:phage repressor protein CI [Photorhabdus australis]
MGLIKVGNDSGGRDAINRLIKAYNFSSRQQLCDHLSVSKNTMSNRYLRDSFPAEWIIQCALETGASLLWLTTGQGEKNYSEAQNQGFVFVDQGHIKPSSEIAAPEIDKATLNSGTLVDQGKTILDNSLIPSTIENPLLIHADDGSYLIDRSDTPPVNGVWLIDIDGIKTIAKLTRLPGNRLVVQQGESSFECSLNDIKILGRAVKTIKSV